MPELLRRSGVGDLTSFGLASLHLTLIIQLFNFYRALSHGSAHGHFFEHPRVMPCPGWIAPARHASVHKSYASLTSSVACYTGGRHLLQSPAPTSQDVQSQVNQVPEDTLYSFITPLI